MIATSTERAELAYRLATRGYPPVLAFRVAMTPPLTVAPESSPDDGSRPGRDLAEAIERRTPDVVQALLFWERWAP